MSSLYKDLRDLIKTSNNPMKIEDIRTRLGEKEGDSLEIKLNLREMSDVKEVGDYYYHEGIENRVDEDELK
jgi:hypothetical protein